MGRKMARLKQHLTLCHSALLRAGQLLQTCDAVVEGFFRQEATILGLADENIGEMLTRRAWDAMQQYRMALLFWQIIMLKTLILSRELLQLKWYTFVRRI